MKLLIVDDEPNIRKILAAMLEQDGYAIAVAEDLAQARQEILKGEVGVVLSDLRLARESGLTLLKWVREEAPMIPVVILTAHGTVDTAVDAMKQGAFDFVLKPFDREELKGVLRKAFLTSQYQFRTQVRTLGLKEYSALGVDDKMRKIAGVIEKVAPSEANVLIIGESGTGKELIAQALHEKSSRAKGPFIKINCAAIPSTLIESECFGFEKGAFTGAVNAKPGRFELAEGGTLFLDEVAEMSIEMQVKLLRVLQDRVFERVGGIRTQPLNVRLITATNKDLDKEVKEGRFRQDLFYRLNVVPISIPPLRERHGDIPILVADFVKRFAERNRKPIPSVSPEVLELLSQYPWPGNVRQLENGIERMIVMLEGDAILPEHLPEEILEYEEERFFGGVSSLPNLRSGDLPGNLKEQVKEVTRRIEKKAIEEALQTTGNNVTQAARLLNISRKGLQLKMKELL